MMQRKDEILAKRAKLAELRRQREEREQRLKATTTQAQATEDSEVAAPSPRRSTDRKDVDSLINEVLGESRSPRTSSPAARPSRPSSTLSTGHIGLDAAQDGPGTPTKASPMQTASTATQTLETIPVAVNYEVAPAPKVEVLSYSKGIQTAEEWSPRRRNASIGSYSASESGRSPSRTLSPRKSKRLSRREREKEEELRQNLRREIEEELKTVKSPVLDGQDQTSRPKYPARALTNEELNAVTSSEDFLDFVEKSSKVIERALDQDYDVLVDYAMHGLEGIDEDEDDGYGSMRGRKGRRIKEVAQFYDERWSKKRMISDIDFSPKFPELLLASYTKNPSAPQDPSGLLQVWNLHLHSRPEYTFHSTSDILTAKFSPFHPSLILGGSYSGQVLLWDTRSKSPLPVQKTPLTGASTGGHTHPVYAISIVGTQNANNIISCSTDGIVCGWSVDMLSQPQEYLELTTPPPSKTEDLSPTCMSFPSADPTSFLVGTEEGTIFPCHRYDRAGAKAGVDARLRYRGHTAPVMSLDFHPARGPVDLGDLVLSTSLDWTVKVWKTRASSSTAVALPAPAATTPSIFGIPPPTTTSSSAANTDQPIPPILDLPREDVVYAARWSPRRPGIFALVDGGGNLEVWDLTQDTEVPVCRAQPEVNKKAVQGMGGYGYARGLNQVKWEEKEGRRIGCGGAGGVVSVFEIGGELAGEAGGAEWGGMKRVVGRLGAGGRVV